MAQQVPISTLHLFPVLDRMLIDLLRSLTPEDWHKPTVAKLWNVKDVAAHLLDGNVRMIALAEGYQSPGPPPQINSYQDLLSFLNGLNASWVNAMKRVSPQVLVQQLEETSLGYISYLNSLDLFAPALYPVPWAGEETSANWFHIAREYTERWHHQQQIRDAIGQPGLMTPELFQPCISTFMYALPHSYRNTAAPDGTVIKFIITTPAGGTWFLIRQTERWILSIEPNYTRPAATVSIAPDVAWRFFTKAIEPSAALAASHIDGDTIPGMLIFETLAVMA